MRFWPISRVGRSWFFPIYFQALEKSWNVLSVKVWEPCNIDVDVCGCVRTGAMSLATLLVTVPTAVEAVVLVVSEVVVGARTFVATRATRSATSPATVRPRRSGFRPPYAGTRGTAWCKADHWPSSDACNECHSNTLGSTVLADVCRS